MDNKCYFSNIFENHYENFDHFSDKMSQNNYFKFYSLNELVANKMIMELFDEDKTIYISRCYYEYPNNWTMISFGSNIYASTNTTNSANDKHIIKLHGQPLYNGMLNLDPDQTNSGFIKEQTYRFIFEDYTDRRYYKNIINNYNYSGSSKVDQIRKEQFLKIFIEVLKNKKYVLGHLVFLKQLYKYLSSLYIEDFNLNDIIFVEAPKIGPVPISVSCIKKYSHNNVTCSTCAFDSICKTVRYVAVDRCQQDEQIYKKTCEYTHIV